MSEKPELPTSANPDLDAAARTEALRGLRALWRPSWVAVGLAVFLGFFLGLLCAGTPHHAQEEDLAAEVDEQARMRVALETAERERDAWKHVAGQLAASALANWQRAQTAQAARGPGGDPCDTRTLERIASALLNGGLGAELKALATALGCATQSAAAAQPAAPQEIPPEAAPHGMAGCIRFVQGIYCPGQVSSECAQWNGQQYCKPDAGWSETPR